MNGKTILVTGSTDGIGRQTAIELARMGATVLIHARDERRGTTALRDLRDAAGTSDFLLVVGDFGSQDDVRRMTRSVIAATGRLDVLVNNAGVYMQKRVLTAEGFETTFAVNHLAPFLLTHLLLPLLKQSAPSRVITVSSVAHQSGSIEFDNLQGERGFGPYRAYAMSKLANLLFSFELAERLAGSGVTANALHPGVIDTKLLRSGFSFQGDTIEKGAETPVFLASSSDVDTVTGKYFLNRREVRASPHARDKKTQRRLWSLSEQLTGVATFHSSPHVAGNLPDAT